MKKLIILIFAGIAFGARAQCQHDAGQRQQGNEVDDEGDLQI